MQNQRICYVFKHRKVSKHVYLLYGVTVSCLPVITNHLYMCTATEGLAPKHRILDVYGGDGQTDRQTDTRTELAGTDSQQC